MKVNPDDLVLFQLYREEDASGVSGTGVVAYGLRFPEPNGRVVLGWTANAGHTSVAIYDSIEAVEDLHGHGGRTKLMQLHRQDTGSP